MELSDFNYNLPDGLIAQFPASPRDSSKLFVIDKKTGEFFHRRFKDIGEFLKKGDIIVLNKSKVFPARLFGEKEGTKGKVEILLLNPESNNKKDLWQEKWRIIGKPKIIKNQRIIFSKDFEGEIVEDLGYEKIIKFNKKGEPLRKIIFSLGKTPIPPYIHSSLNESKLRNKYQTVYAKEFGSVAAPTAGLHFTKSLINKLKKKGVCFKYITLHVGLGTFQPIKTEKVEDHKMRKELAFIDKKTADFLNKAKKQGRRIISVGTTSTRTLESFADNGKINVRDKMADIFIFPGYKLKFVDALITNFHLPKSTPLLLACSFLKKDIILKAYREAIKKNYRFYSFGDAMFIC